MAVETITGKIALEEIPLKIVESRKTFQHALLKMTEMPKSFCDALFSSP